MDGSQKLPQRMLDSVRWHLSHGSSFELLALGVASWMRYVGGIDEQGNHIEISDPLLAEIQTVVTGSSQGEKRVDALLSLTAIFGHDLVKQPRFTQAVHAAYRALLEKGAKATVAHYLVQLKK